MTTITKTLSSITPAGGGAYALAYTLSVARTGNGPDYRLEDEFRFGAAVTVGSVAVTSAPVVASVNPTFDGRIDQLIATVVPIASGVTHTYTVVVNVSVDASGVTFDNTDCSITGAETGSGFLNTAALVTNGIRTTGEACAPVPAQPTITKTATPSSPFALGDGLYRVGYTLTVTNVAAGAGTYDLHDTLAFGAGITVASASMVNPIPGTIAIVWDGRTDTEVVTGQAIEAGTAGEPTVHVYNATVVVLVPAGLTATAADCTISGAETGSGLSNTATLTVNTVSRSAGACVPLPMTTIDKQLLSVVPNGDGTFTLQYEINVERTVDGPNYTLTDSLRFGAAVSVISVTPGATTPLALATTLTSTARPTPCSRTTSRSPTVNATPTRWRSSPRSTLQP